MKIAADIDDIRAATQIMNGRLAAALPTVDAGEGEEGYNPFSVDNTTDRMLTGDLFDSDVANTLIAGEVKDWWTLLLQAAERENYSVEDVDDLVDAMNLTQVKILRGMYSQAMALGVLMERERVKSNLRAELRAATEGTSD